MTELKRLWNMNLESVAGRLNSLFVLSKDTQLFTVGTNGPGDIPVVFESQYNAVLYIHDQFPQYEWKKTVSCLTLASNVCMPEQTPVIAVMRPLVITCPGCGQAFSETKRPPQYGTVICPNCGALVRLNTPSQRL